MGDATASESHCNFKLDSYTIPEVYKSNVCFKTWIRTVFGADIALGTFPRNVLSESSYFGRVKPIQLPTVNTLVNPKMYIACFGAGTSLIFTF